MAKDRIVGIWDGHDSGVAVISRTAIEWAANEERYTRRKLEIRFPALCLQAAPNLEACETLAYSTTDIAKTLGRFVPGTKEKYYQVRRRMVPPSKWNRFAKRIKYPVTVRKGNFLSRGLSDFHVAGQLKRLGCPPLPIRAFDHHHCHLASAACTAGPGDWTVLSLDGVGDGRSGAIAEFRKGRINEISSLPAEKSLGVFFEHITNLLNMRELEDEGKVMALADFACPIEDSRNPLFDFLSVDGLQITTCMPASAMYASLEKVFRCFPSEQFAFMAQRVLQTCIVKLVGNAIAKTGLSQVAMAGGVASNIKANLLINEMPEVEKLHVFPHMGDGGLAMGAACAATMELWGDSRYDLESCCFGDETKDTDLEKMLEQSGVASRRCESIEEEIARILCKGEIVIFYQGRMEYGPRALGNRSILALPDSRETAKTLNLRLKKRVYYQPFCPSMLESDAKEMLHTTKSANPYMTIGYRVKDTFKNAMAGVMSIDQTCRPQIIPDNAPTPLAGVLREVKKQTGHGVLLNTSLNVHGQPLARTAQDALAVYREMGIRYAALGSCLVGGE